MLTEFNFSSGVPPLVDLPLASSLRTLRTLESPAGSLRAAMAPPACPPAPAAAAFASSSPAEPTLTVAVSLLLSYAAYRAVYRLVPALAEDLVAKGLRGRDMLKAGFRRDDPPTEKDDDEQADIPGRKYL